jgi:hypothetical protein
MGSWNRLKTDWLWRSQVGSVTVEAAIGIAALLAVTITLVQILTSAFVYLQVLGVAQEAARIASATGSLELRVSQALDFVESVDSGLQSEFELSGAKVGLTISTELPFAVPGLPKTISVSVESLRVDQVVW